MEIAGRSRFVLAVLVAGLTPLALASRAAAPGGASAPAAPAAAEVTRTTVLENDRVRAQINDYPPGSRTLEHEHSVPRVVVVLQGGTLEIRGAGGEVKTLQLKAGDVVWRPAEKHTISNPGPGGVRVVEIDVRDCPG